MIYIIKDVTKNLFGREKIRVVKVCVSENAILSFLGSAENLKLFRGDISVERVVL